MGPRALEIQDQYLVINRLCFVGSFDLFTFGLLQIFELDDKSFYQNSNCDIETHGGRIFTTVNISNIKLGLNSIDVDVTLKTATQDAV